MKRVCVVHNNVDQATAIGKLASWAVTTALDAGLHVTVVARDLDPGLQEEVRWRRLFVPPRLHAVQWAVARQTVLNALRGVDHDVLHVYQPQIAALADTWHVEFLSRVAVETGSVPSGVGPRSRLARAQRIAVAHMEDRYLRALGARPTVLFCSPLIERHFTRLYGTPVHREILLNPAFARDPVLVPSRTSARRGFGLPAGASIVGYLGGLDERKGYPELISAMAALPDTTVLLMAGPGSEGFSAPGLGVRVKPVGKLTDMAAFWAAVDILAVPSRFEPFGMVVTEAASVGVPVVVTPEVGAAELVRQHRAGEVVESSDLAAGIALVQADVNAYAAGLRSLAASVSSGSLSVRLLEAWTAAAARNARRARPRKTRRR
jgi:glycosyltransferase involved in cell wall biosynthesis